jgi:D-glycero-D-manno-heptose 1,7-bisphosphate phosphatase
MNADAGRVGRPAVFLDRDGTLNVEKNYLYRIEDWEWIPGAKDAVLLLNNAGFVVVVVTNQAGIARGLYAERDVQRLHAHMQAELNEVGAHVDAVYHCPHHPDHGLRVECNCRKPAPGMLLKAAVELQLDLGRSYMVGDRETDIEAARRSGVTPLLVLTGYGERTRERLSPPGPIFQSVLDAAKEAVRLLNDDRSRKNK